MAVRRAAGERWAARRAEEARLVAEEEGDEYISPIRASTEPGSPQEDNSLGKERKQRKQKTAPAAQFAHPPWMVPPAPMPYGSPYAPPYGSPYGMYPPDPYMAGMYPNPWMGMPPMGPPMYPGMMMPQMYPGHGMGMPGMTSPMHAGGGKSKGRGHVGTEKGGQDTRRRKGDGKGMQPTSPAVSGASTTKSKHASSPGASEDKSPGMEAMEDVPPGLSATLREARKATCELSLGDVMSEVLDFAKDKYGAHFLESKLENASKLERQGVFEAILPEVVALSSDACGNVVVQKIFEVGTVEHKRDMISRMQAVMLQLAIDQHGCRVIQTALDHVSRECHGIIAAGLEQDVVQCIESKHGNHVIQKCIEQMPPDYVDFIIRAVEAAAERMSQHPYGCRVVQRLLEHCSPPKLEGMLEKILARVEELARDPYGNYVVQHVMEYGRLEDKKRVMWIVQNDVANLAVFRFSSNVVETCFTISTNGRHKDALEKERASLLQTLLGQPGDANAPVYSIMADRFGNHVLMHVFKHTKAVEERDLLKRQLSAATNLSATGRRILDTLKKEPEKVHIPTS